jgi:hypothetical protein
MKKIALALLAIALLLPLTTAFAKKSDVENVKPMKGEFWGTWQSDYMGDPDATDAGNGLFTHLGRSSFLGTLTTTWISELEGSVEGIITLTAANGDKLYVEVAGTQTMNPLFTFSDFIGPYTITGGTGRFEGATGAGTITAHLTINWPDCKDGDITGSLEGTLVTLKP